jgi:hypothetical protein
MVKEKEIITDKKNDSKKTIIDFVKKVYNSKEDNDEKVKKTTLIDKYFSYRKKEKHIYCCKQSLTPSIKGYIDILDIFYKNYSGKCKIWIPDGYNNIDEQLKNVKSQKDQIIFALPNCDLMVSKHDMWDILVRKYGRKKSSSIVPETFLLDKQEDINMLKSLKLKTNEKIILKKKKQRKEGLKITQDIDYIVNKSIEDDYLIAQRMITPFLVNKRKINLRVYLFLTLKNDILSAYMSDHISCIYTKDEYNELSDSFETNITSYKMDMSIYETNPQTKNQLKTYLNDNGYDSDILFEQIKTKISLFLTPFKDYFKSTNFKDNKLSQVFGLDFILNEKCEPYLLEYNKGPSMKPYNPYKEIPDINDNITKQIDELKECLNQEINSGTLKNIKKIYKNIFNGYPKTMKVIDILKSIENFYENEKINTYPSGYISGNGLKVQKDTFEILGLLKYSKNNGYKKILEIKI